ncbi:MAG: hypothetical protein KDN19_00145 [Verrucomicrobiae bacterium]|nr:hypothetical protein [Verrucomicrobiae bacterium]
MKFEVSRFLSIPTLAAVGLFSIVSEVRAEPPAWSGNPDATFVIKTLPGMMRYDTTELFAAPGDRIKLSLENDDDLQHNLVVLKTDPNDKDGQKFAQAVFTSLGDKAIAMGWVPRDDPRIIVATQLLDPHASEAIYFEAPEEPGDYPFVCTVPGHSLLMRGTIRVQKAIEVLTDLTYSIYEGKWDKLPDFSTLKPTKTGDLPSGKLDIGVAKDLKGGFGIVFEGKLHLTDEEDYRFFLASDDGSRLIIDGEGIIDRDGVHPMGSPKEEMLRLQEGVHSLRVVYFEKSGQRGLSLAMRSKSLGWQDLSVQTTNKKAQKAPPKPILLTPKNGEAITFRAFLPGVNPRSIAVGYPGGVNLAWDADVLNLSRVWRGGFLNVASNWDGRGSGSQISGYDQAEASHGFPFQQLESLDEPWMTVSKASIKYERDVADPQKEISFYVKNPDYQFEGYRLEPGNRFPTFRYRYHDVEIEDTFAPSEIDGREALVRTVTLRGKVPEKTYFRLADSGNLERNDSGWYAIEPAVWLKLDSGGEPVLRNVEGGKDLVLPIEPDTEKTELKMTYWWQTKIGGRVKPD